MKSIFKEVKVVSDVIKNGRNATNIVMKSLTELGELAEEVSVKYNKSEYKAGSDDGILGEATDVLICLFDLLITEGKLQLLKI